MTQFMLRKIHKIVSCMNWVPSLMQAMPGCLFECHRLLCWMQCRTQLLTLLVFVCCCCLHSRQSFVPHASADLEPSDEMSSTWCVKFIAVLDFGFQVPSVFVDVVVCLGGDGTSAAEGLMLEKHVSAVLRFDTSDWLLVKMPSWCAVLNLVDGRMQMCQPLTPEKAGVPTLAFMLLMDLFSL